MGDIVIPSDWNGKDYCCFSVMWPNSRGWLAVLNGLIDAAGTGFSYNEATGSVTDAIAAIRQTWVYNFKNEVVIMTCTTAVSDALLQIAAALQNSGSGCGCIPGATGGSGGAGMVPGTPSTVDTGADNRDGPPPPGFDSWDDYDDYACRVAAFIIDQIKVDVATSAIVDIGEQDAWALAGILVTLFIEPVGWVVLLGIAGLMLENTILAVAYADVVTWLDDHKDDLVCALLSGTDVGSSINAVVEKIDEILDDEGGFGGTLGLYWARRYIKSWFSIDNVNRMYNKQPVDYPAYTCPCGGFTVFEIFNPGGAGQSDYGTLVRTGNHYTGSSEPDGSGGHRWNAHAIRQGTSDGRCMTIENLTITGSTHTGDDDYYYPCNSTTPTICPSGDAINLEGDCIHGFILASNTSFTIEFDGVPCE